MKFHGFLHLIRTNIPFVWDENAQGDFDALKQALNSSPLLSPPKFTKEFILYVSVLQIDICIQPPIEAIIMYHPLYMY